MKIQKKHIAVTLGVVAINVVAALTLTSCSQSEAASDAQFSPKQLADSINIVLKSDRKVYARDIVTRLKNEGVITPHEEWQAKKTLLLPAQIFRRGAEEVDKVPEKTVDFSYSLQSIWPLNYENAMKKTPVVEEGLQFGVDTDGEVFYGEETIGDQDYFIAIYPDKAVAQACWECHNEHENRKADYPEFKQGDVMGGVVIRIPID